MKNIPNLNSFWLFLLLLILFVCSGDDLKEIKHRANWTTSITAAPITAAVTAIFLAVAAWNVFSVFTELSWWNCGKWSGQFQFQFEHFGLRRFEMQFYTKSTLFCISGVFHLLSELMIVCKICILRHFNFQLGNERKSNWFEYLFGCQERLWKHEVLALSFFFCCLIPKERKNSTQIIAKDLVY